MRSPGAVHLFIVLAQCLALVASAHATDTADTPPTPALSAGEARARIEEARPLISTDIDSARRLLLEVLNAPPDSTEIEREAYLLLIKGCFLAGNFFDFQEKGKLTRDLYYQEGERLIVRCLSRPDLRDTEPSTEGDYPKEMIEAFTRVRNRDFGTFRVSLLSPPDASVALDGSLLGEESPLEAHDLLPGAHEITVRAHGFRTLNETIQLEAGTTLERSYELQRGRDLVWWLTRGGLALGTGTLVFLAWPDGGSDVAEPLPEPPTPPSAP